MYSQIEPLLERALEISDTHTPEDVRRSLLAGQSQLWAQMDGDTVQAVVTTEFVNYPKGAFVRAWCAGARRDCKLDVNGFFGLLSKWCRQHDCIGFEAVGRIGWLRKVPDVRVDGLVMRVVLPPEP